MARQKGVVVPITATDNTARAFDSLNQKVARLEAQLGGVSSRGGAAGNAIAGGMSHATPQIAAASGAIRELEGGLPIRAIERFLTTTLGLGPALAAAFPAVGAIALGGVILENVAKLRAFAQAGRDTAKTVEHDFDAITDSVRKSGIELDIANDKARNTLATLAHKPENLLKLALDEDRKELLQIAIDATNAKEKVDELLKKDSIGFAKSLGLLALGQNVSITTNSDKVVKDAYGAIEKASRAADNAQESASPQDAEAVKLKNRAELARVTAEQIKKVRQELERVYTIQRNDTDQTDFSARTRTLEKSLDDLRARQHNLGAGNDSVDLGAQVQKAEENKRNNKSGEDAARKAEEAARKAEELRRRQADADEKSAAAQRSLDDANARSKAAGQKAGTDAELDALESGHRALLVSDEDYFAQREAIQKRAIGNQRDAIATQRNDLQSQVAGAEKSGQGLTGLDAENNNSRIVELKSKIVDLGVKDAALTSEAARNTRIRADAETELAVRKIADADRLAVQLEQERGGSVTARQTQSRDEYGLRRRQLVGEFGSEDAPAVRALDNQQGIDQDSIAAKGAEQDFGAAQVGLGERRGDITYRQRRGQVSTKDAQAEKIALEREEADALQPVLAAYEKLAADGDLSAISKVVELKGKIAELKDPVNDVASEIRGQLDSAFERVFENMDRGKKALAEFGKMIQSELSKEAYKNFIQPGVQAGLGLLIPNSRGQNLPQSPQSSGAKGLLAGILPSIPGFGGAFGGVKSEGQKITVKIDNQSSTPVGATQAGGSTSDMEGLVIGMVLKDLNQGGALAKAFGM